MARPDPFGQTPFLPPPPSKSNNRGAFTQHGRYQFVDPQQQQQSQSQNSNNDICNQFFIMICFTNVLFIFNFQVIMITNMLLWKC